jgi:esterase/lipase superfamily enzyme
MSGVFDLRRFLILGVLIVLSACAPRGIMTVVPPDTVPGPTTSVFVGSTRMLAANGTYGPERFEGMNYGRFDISVPPVRQAGEINWPKRANKPNVTTDFLTTQRVFHPDGAAFRSDLSKALNARGKTAIIYVHGYNNTFTEGLYRIAQLSHDLNVPGVAVHYSWPSAAEPLGYIYDRDSALFARDGLERLIRDVAAAGAQRITLVSHSMGGALVMEALRQIDLRDGRILRQIDGVILISPDIDVDVFRSQALSIGELPQPFVIFGSGKDSVLRLSSLITGQNGRVGSMDDVTRVADLNVTYLDVAAFSSGNGHFVAGTSEALLLLLGRITDVSTAFAGDRAGRTGLLTGAVLTVRRATRVILYPVGELTGERLN